MRATALAALGVGLLLSPLASAQAPKAKILSDNGAYHRVYVKDGASNRVFGMDARIGIAGILGGSRPHFLRLHYADGNTIRYARLRRGGTMEVGKRMRTNSRELAKVFAAMGRPKMAQALKALSRRQGGAGPYRSAGVSFGGIWKDPGVGVTLPNGDRLYFKMEGEGKHKVGHNPALGRPRMRLSYGLARVNGTVDRKAVVLHGTTFSDRQQKNNARKLNQALDYLEAQLVSAVQP